jgi:NAD(P)-dependent dehydrogenase (short-subunit alcohol dehydrogenase family)
VSWQGKVAVVTGASSGIGESTTRRLAGTGMTVVAVARRRDRLEQLATETGPPGRVVPYEADVTDTAAVDALAAWVRREFGACHALINNAGVPGGALEGRDDLDDALHTLEVNLLGTVRCLAAFVDLLEASAPSRVVNIGSVAGKLGIGPAAYAASKFGVVGLSEALSFSWAPRGITVCQLNPGYITTEGFPQTHLRDSAAERMVGHPDDVAEGVVEVLRTGVTERTVPSWYRAFVTFRHLAPPAYRAIAMRLDRARGRRD